jgi:hypothetical protein
MEHNLYPNLYPNPNPVSDHVLDLDPVRDSATQMENEYTLWVKNSAKNKSPSEIISWIKELSECADLWSNSREPLLICEASVVMRLTIPLLARELNSKIAK